MNGIHGCFAASLLRSVGISAVCQQIIGSTEWRLSSSTLLTLGLPSGADPAAQAQSIAALPPSDTSLAITQSPITPHYRSTQSFYPKPGGSGLFNA
jgi:hypothetical protein